MERGGTNDIWAQNSKVHVITDLLCDKLKIAQFIPYPGIEKVAEKMFSGALVKRKALAKERKITGEEETPQSNRYDGAGTGWMCVAIMNKQYAITNNNI